MATLLPVVVTVNTTGLFKVKEPFAIAEDVIYTVEAVRTFPELVDRKEDVYNKYYLPVGLGREAYLADANVGGSILTLKSRDGQVVYIPDTYIESYPGINGLEYKRNVMVIDLAFIPSYVDPTTISEDVKNIITAGLGIDPIIDITSMDYEGTVTEENHLQMEAVRKAKIRNTTPVSEQLVSAQQENAKLKALNAAMLEILQANGLAN
ncbi:hypothetical protein STRATTON_223 [Erwinia phage vB_EamM_Stratton]|uniref:Uncharacterized protein n=2 Tax=Erskinevirus EaH2 TaxID=2169883 RepID=A0A1B2IHB1_9CAUD|nr:hypothetical protein G173_gp123 [Erwinia phage phiEaH2]AFQ96668.1 hypothetical protein [Erwinia phage phiEaH2]ANZ50648.1 hypothetical protein STRATTON_223 [Erwinia phage vB_EamM_Stratton]